MLLAYECLMTEQLRCRTGQDWDKNEGKEISDASRPSHKPTTNSETTDSPFLYGHRIYIRGVTISQTEPKDRDTPPTIRIAELSWRTAVLSRPLLPIVEVNGTYL